MNSKHSTQAFGVPQAPSFLSLSLTLPSWQALPVSGKVSLWWKNGHCSSLLPVPPPHSHPVPGLYVPLQNSLTFLLKKPERPGHFLPGYPGSHPLFPVAFRPAGTSRLPAFLCPEALTYDLTVHLSVSLTHPHILPVPRHIYVGPHVKRQRESSVTNTFILSGKHHPVGR